MAYVNTVIKDFADYMEPAPFRPKNALNKSIYQKEQCILAAPKPLKVVEPDDDTVRFIKFLEREERNFDRMKNRIIKGLEVSE